MMKTTENRPGKSLLGQLGQLEPGQSLTVPVARMSYLRSACTSFGLQWGKKFSVSANREKGTITAVRVS